MTVDITFPVIVVRRTLRDNKVKFRYLDDDASLFSFETKSFFSQIAAIATQNLNISSFIKFVKVSIAKSKAERN